MKEIITYILASIGLIIIVYVLSKVQMHAWLNVIEKFFKQQKSKENEQKKKK